MSFSIKTLLKVDGGEYTLPLPQKQKEFDQYLTEAGILTGDRSEYEIIEIECSISELNDILKINPDIEELNYFAQLLCGYEDHELNNYAAIVRAKEDISINGLIDLACKLNTFEIEPNVTDYDELGKRFIDEEYPDLDPLISENINYESLGEDVKLQELGEFTDAGYIKEFNKIFFNSKYDGKSFPSYDYERGYSLKIRMCNGMVTDDCIDEYAEVILPADGNILSRAMRRIGVDNLHNCFVGKYYSDRFGQDMMQLFGQDETILSLNELAMEMDKVPRDQIEEYKEAVAYEMVEGDVEAMIVLTKQFMSGEYQKYRTVRDSQEESIRNLTASAVSLAKGYGADAAKDIARIKEQVEKFVEKWDLTEKWLDQFDMDVADAIRSEQPDETEDQESDMGMSMM